MSYYNFKDELLTSTLVLTIKKSFWASSECRVFPHRIYPKISHGAHQTYVNSLFHAVRGLRHVVRYGTKLIIFGSAHRTVPWFIRFKQMGLLSNVKLVATNQIHFTDKQAHYLDRIITYSRSSIALHTPSVRHKHIFMPLPADGDFEQLPMGYSENYIFSGGGNRRDFATLIEATRDLDIKVKIITFSTEMLDSKGKLPDNCELYGWMPLNDFLSHMARSLFVVVPLKEFPGDHGHTTVVQALRLGKPVITTQNASVDDYITDGQEGFLVKAGDVAGYRQAIIKLLNDNKFRHSCEKNAVVRAQDLTYAAFAQRLAAVTRDLLHNRR